MNTPEQPVSSEISALISSLLDDISKSTQGSEASEAIEQIQAEMKKQRLDKLKATLTSVATEYADGVTKLRRFKRSVGSMEARAKKALDSIRDALESAGAGNEEQLDNIEATTRAAMNVVNEALMIRQETPVQLFDPAIRIIRDVGRATSTCAVAACWCPTSYRMSSAYCTASKGTCNYQR